MNKIFLGIVVLVLLVVFLRMPVTVSYAKGDHLKKGCYAKMRIIESAIQYYNADNSSSPLTIFEGEKTQKILFEAGFLKGRDPLRCTRKRREPLGFMIDFFVGWFSPVYEDAPESYVFPAPIGSGPFGITCRMHGPISDR